MKKLLIILFTILSIPIFACSFSEQEINDLTDKINAEYPEYTASEVAGIIAEMNGFRLDILETGSGIETVENISSNIINSGAVVTFANNPALRQTVIDEQKRANESGAKLEVVIGPGGRNIKGKGKKITVRLKTESLQNVTQSPSGTTIGPSTKLTTITANETTTIYQSNVSSIVSQTVQDRLNSVKKLYNVDDNYVPYKDTTDGIDENAEDAPLSIIKAKKVSSVGVGDVVISTRTPEISGSPSIVTTTTTEIKKANGDTTTINTSSSKLLAVQKSTTTIVKKDGTSHVVTNYGDVVGDTVNGSIVQSRAVFGSSSYDVIEVIQGNSVTIKSGHVFIDDVDTGYTQDMLVVVYQVTVHSVNGDPTVIEYDEEDTVGSENIITYWVNGKDTGITVSTRVTKTILMENGTIVSCRVVGTKDVNGTLYYVLDGEVSEYTVSEGDVIRDSYVIIDPVAQNKEFINSITTATVIRNGKEIIRTNLLGQKAIGTITKDGQTISGELSYAKVYVITYNNATYVSKSVAEKGGFLYLDGVNSNIPYNDSSISYVRKYCYIVNGNLTSVEYSENDNVSYELYYTDNGTITEYKVLGTDEIVKETVDSKSGNIEVSNSYKITSSGNVINGKSVSIKRGKEITTASGDVIYYYNSKEINPVEFVMLNNVKLGKKSDAEFYTVERNTVRDVKIFSINSSNGIKEVGSATPPYYLPKAGWFLFVNGGKIYKLNYLDNDYPKVVYVSGFPYDSYEAYKVDGTGAIIADKGKTKMLAYGFSIPSNASATLGPVDAYGDVVVNKKLKQYPYSQIDSADIYLPSIVVKKSSASHCIYCFNTTSGVFVSEDGYSGGQSAAIAVREDGVIKCGEGHLNKAFTPSSAAEWAEVCAIGPNSYNGYPVFALRKKDNSIYIAKGINGYTNWKMVSADGITGKQMISDKNGTLYVLSVDGSSVKKISITDINAKNGDNPTFSVSNIDTNGIKSKIKYVNDKLYGIDSDGSLYSCPSSSSKMEVVNGINNVYDIEVCGYRLLAVAEVPSVVISVPVVKINGNVYDQSEVSIETRTVYTLDGKETFTEYSQNDTETDITFCDIVTNDGKTSRINYSSVSDVSLESVATTSDGYVVAYITGSTGEKYCINGIDTSVDFDVEDSINILSKKTYYIGDIDTGIESSGDDDIIDIDGDYWIINGHNTTVKSFGLGEMCIKISDITPGEVVGNEETSTSSVVVPLVIRGHIVRFDEDKPITSIKLQYRRLTDANWTNLKELTNAKRKLETPNMQAIFGRYVNIPVGVDESFYVRVNISDGTSSTVTASSLNPEPGNVFYYSFMRSSKTRVK